MARGDLDLTREDVLTIFRDAENADLTRHTGTPGSDGTGTLRVLCGCGQGYSALDWELHCRAIAKRAHELRPRKSR